MERLETLKSGNPKAIKKEIRRGLGYSSTARDSIGISRPNIDRGFKAPINDKNILIKKNLSRMADIVGCTSEEVEDLPLEQQIDILRYALANPSN